jgi:imidazolonepropionase-like amidohydrolase
MNNYFKRYIFTLAIILAGNAATAQQKTMLIKNAYLHVGNGETLASAAIGIKNGKITLIKNSLAYSYSVSDWDTIIDVKGKHVYPGFIAPNTTLGITEIDAVRATRDFHEVGIYNPHVRSQIAYNVESEVIKTVRSNGVLLSQPVPRGGVISGT